LGCHLHHDRFKGIFSMTSKTSRILFFFLLAFFLSRVAASPPDERVRSDLASRLQASVLSKDSTAYSDLFSPPLRERETAFQHRLLEVFAVDRASFFSTNESTVGQDQSRIFLQVILENDYLAIVQSWELRLDQDDPRGLIGAKTIRDDPGLLYKIKMPSDRVEFVPLVEIDQEDISLAFTNAYVFFDNIPEVETALLIIGDGLVSYHPSDPKERHQLDLAYKTQKIQEKSEYVFCRFSHSFFEEHVRIKRKGDRQPVSVPGDVKARAAALFDKHYPRFYTVVSPLTQQPLSFLPQGEETVLEFRTARKKEFTYIFSPFAEEEIHFLEQPESKLINLYSPPAQDGLRNMFISFRQKFDVQHYDLEVSFWPKTTWLAVRARVSVLSNIDSLDALKFRLNKDLEIERILDQQGRELFFTQDKIRDMLYIYFLEAYDQGTFFSFEITYHGRLVPPDQTNDVLAAGQLTEILILAPPKFDSFLFSRSAAWYPGPSEDDFFTAQQKIIVPAGYACQANGLLLEHSESKGPSKDGEAGQSNRGIFVFRTKRPVKYLSFIVGDFDQEAELSQPLPLSYFVTSSIFMGKLEMSAISNVLRFYEGLFGPYPYEKLAVVQRQWFSAGGHSPASFAVLNEMPRAADRRVRHKVGSPVDLSRWKEYFLAHEIAHQWWGQCVTWKSYHDQWIGEGLAQFATAQFLRQKYGEKTYAGIMEKFCQWTDKMSVWGQISLGSRLSILNFEAYQAIIYNKTSAVLNLLLEVIGPEAFWSGMRDFYQAHRFSAARTADFVTSMEKASGRELGLFFKSWFDSYALPRARIVLGEVKNGQERFLQVRVSQESEIFVYPLWLEWSDEGAKVSRKIIVEAKETSVLLPFRGRLKDVKVNPVRWVPGRLTIDR
jgi:hypothetical protein